MQLREGGALKVNTRETADEDYLFPLAFVVLLACVLYSPVNG